MDWMQRMNEALAYVEAHLDDEIDLKVVSKIAHCSPYHFQRVFSYMAGTSLAEYIRRRRLTMAAFALQQEDAKVIDVALRYGYDSPTAFSRAFAALHGMPPSEARQAQRPLTAYPPLSFQITVQGVTAMNYQIEERASFRVVGAKITVPVQHKEGFAQIPLFWQRAYADGTVPALIGLMDGEPKGVLGISVGNWQTHDTVDYYIAVASDQSAPAGLEAYTVPASTWAIFEAIGPNPATIQGLQHRVVTEWLPSSGYDYGDAPDLEIYASVDQTAPDCKSYVWLPIVKKS